MFGNKKVVKKAAPAAPETPDLVVQKPAENMGMPGFTSEEAPAQAPAQTGIPGFGSVGAPLPQTPVAEETEAVTQAVASPLSIQQAPVAPVAPAPVVEEVAGQYQVVAAEILSDGMFKYVIVSNKNLGEVGGVYVA